MEFKVWVEGIQRIVCGVTDSTTCQDIVFALAHATGKSGRFTLTERWRNNERHLAPMEHPLRILMKWGEYTNDVQFILQCTDSSGRNSSEDPNRFTSITIPSPIHLPNKVYSPSSNIHHATYPLFRQQKTQMYSYFDGFVKNANVQSDTFQTTSQQTTRITSIPNKCSLIGNTANSDTSPSSHRLPPPYRNPPAVQKPSENNAQQIPLNSVENQVDKLSTVLYSAQCRELMKLITSQQEKLFNQQIDLNKYDTEIVLLEVEEVENQKQYDTVIHDLKNITNTIQAYDLEIQALAYVEEEIKLVRQQERTIKSEMTLLRSKLANCETQLLQCKNKTHILTDEYQYEKRLLQNRSSSKYRLMDASSISGKHVPTSGDVERLQHDIELIKKTTEINIQNADVLQKQMQDLEIVFNDKKQQLETLVTEMKVANLESLTVVTPCAEDVRCAILDGSAKLSGSTRRMIGSPRQLENAVPTSKNPHGVWV